jgi:hypothetical protein
MIELKTSIRFSFGLCLISGIALFLSNLALMDIGHGESDVTLEWRILQISYAVFILFHVSVFITLARLMKLKNIRKTEP